MILAAERQRVLHDRALTANIDQMTTPATRATSNPKYTITIYSASMSSMCSPAARISASTTDGGTLRRSRVR